MMYEAFYGLTDEPFSLTPNPKFLYLSKTHEGGLEQLLYGIARKRGLIVLTGAIGTGKTTLLKTLIQRINDTTHIALVVHSQLSPLDLYQYLFHELALPTDCRGKTEGDLLRMLGDFLGQCATKGENCLLIVDEAQNLSPDVLEQIRLFLNFETYDGKLLQIILVGHPELHDKLNLSASIKLKQRVSMSYHLLPLDETETQEYIDTRLRVAGARHPIYTENAIAEVYRYSQGIPRVINIVCDLALVLGYGQHQEVVDREIILQVTQRLHGEAAHVPRVRSREQTQEHAGQASRLHSSAGNVPLQDVRSSSSGRRYLDVVSKIQGQLHHDAAAASSQVPASGWCLRGLALGGMAASLAVSLLFWGDFLHAPASLKYSVSPLVQSVVSRFTASPAAPPSAAPAATGPERLSLAPSAPLTPSPVMATLQAATSLPVVPQESHLEPTSTAVPLFPQEYGRMDSTRLSGTLGATLVPSDAISAPAPQSTPRVVVVQAGDTLGSILLRTYKRLDRRLVTLVQEANPTLMNPAHIEIGQRIVLPTLAQ